MHVSGPIPFHVARAYGQASAARPQFGAPADHEQATGTPAAPQLRAAQSAARISGPLIAGKVSGSVDFTGAIPTAGHSHSLYNRAADRVEAATAITIGRSLDLRA